LALAAVLLWHDDLTDEQIAARCGVSRRTLARWKHHPFVQRAFAAYQADSNERRRRDQRRACAMAKPSASEAAAVRQHEANVLLRSFQDHQDRITGRKYRKLPHS
jgi:hypothetical protein